MALGHLGITFSGRVAVPGVISGYGRLAIPGPSGLLLIGVLLLIAWSFPNTQQIFARFDPALDFKEDRGKFNLLQRKMLWQPSLVWALLIGCLSAFSIISLTKSSEFLYFQF
jgi:alginate O-acetyltransferase complex protein AlgI